MRVIHGEDVLHTPNDPKLSDGGGWRSPCAGAGGGGRRWWKAWAVTAGAVRCSAWLGDMVELEFASAVIRSLQVELSNDVEKHLSRHLQ